VGEKKNQRIPLFLSTCNMCIECGGTFIWEYPMFIWLSLKDEKNNLNLFSFGTPLVHGWSHVPCIKESMTRY
jgi:hypothetical protein